MFTDNFDKANILNEPFTSVYTIEDDCSKHLQTLKVPYFPTIPPLHIEAQGIYTLLSELEFYKADGIPLQLLKELSTHIAPVLALIFNASFHQGKLSLD